MATTISSTILAEKGTGIIQVVFTDEDGTSVTPNAGTIKWTLTDNPLTGDTATVINSRTLVDITSASTINIVLEGDDLALQSGETNELFVQRVLSIQYQYDSVVQSNLDDKAEHIFKIENLKYVT
jgi:hypothetical protein